MIDSSTLIERIKENQNKDRMLANALSRLVQLYTDKVHFIFELLQNAEDAEATKIQFVMHEDCLEVIHDGNPFTESNLRALCDVGMSDKLTEINKIGQFGIGFKSVFTISDKLDLFSSPNRVKRYSGKGYPEFAVHIHDFVQLEERQFNHLEIPEGYTTKFIFYYSVGQIHSSFDDIAELKDKLAARLQSLDSTTLLFMHNLQEISFEISLVETKAVGNYAIESGLLQGCRLVYSYSKLNDNPSVTNSYLVFSKNIGRIGDSLTDKTVDIAIPAKSEPLRISIETVNPYVFVYFPTTTESNLPFIIQGPFRTTPDRSKIPFEAKENSEIVKHLASLLADVVKWLKNAGLLSLEFLAMLPLRSDEVEEKDSFTLFEPLYDEVDDLFASKKIIPTLSGDYTDVYHSLIARSKQLVDMFSDKLISKLINDYDYMLPSGGIRQYYWLPLSLTETNRELRKLYDYLTKEFEEDDEDRVVRVVRPSDISSFIRNNTDFIKNQSVNEIWLFRFYEFVGNISELHEKKATSDSMMTLPIIKTDKGKMVSPYISAGRSLIPNVFIPGEEKYQNINYVADSILRNCSEIIQAKFGIGLPDEYEGFVSSLRNRYSGDSIEVENAQNASDLKRIIKYLNDSTKADALKAVLCSISYIIARDTVSGEDYLVNPAEGNVYFSKVDGGVDAFAWFKNIIVGSYWSPKNVYVVCSDIYSSYGITEAMIGQLPMIKNTLLDFIRHKDWFYKEGWGNLLFKDLGDFLSDFYISGAEAVVEFIDKDPNNPNSREKSRILWQYLLDNQNHFVGKYLQGKGDKTERNGQARILDIVSSSRHAWLYSNDGTAHPPMELRRSDLDDDLYRKPLKSELYKMLGFKDDENDKRLLAVDSFLSNDKETLDIALDEILRKKYGNQFSSRDIDKYINEANNPEQYLESFLQSRYNIDLSKADEILLRCGTSRNEEISDEEFEQKLKTEYGYTIAEFEQIIDSASTKEQPYFDNTYLRNKLDLRQERINVFSFPSKRVKHPADFANAVYKEYRNAPRVKFESRVQQVRVSEKPGIVRDYIKNAYYDPDSGFYVCQICGKPIDDTEIVQIEANPKRELKAMHLCLCPECAKAYRKKRDDTDKLNDFLYRLRKAEYTLEEPIPVAIDNIEVHFNQSHLLEIKILCEAEYGDKEHMRQYLEMFKG